MSRPNLNGPTFDEPREHEGFRCLRSRLGHQIGTEKIGLSLWEVPPGEAAYPYHFHLAEEEVLIVLRGRPSLRTATGWSELEEGDVVRFGLGEDGAHQVLNGTGEAVTFLAISNQQPDIVVYPDSGKLGSFERSPDGGGLKEMFRLADAVDYYDGEEPPQSE